MSDEDADPRFPHLPPGHTPGKQSRKRRTGSTAGVVVFVVIGLVLIGLAIVGISADSEQGFPVWIAVLIGIGGLGSFVWAWIVGRRTGAPRTPGYFAVSAQPSQLRRGGKVEAELRISDPSKVGEGFEVGLVCAEYYDRTKTVTSGTAESEARETAEAVAHEEWTSASQTDPVQSFSFQVPEEAPFSHEGAALSFAWRICARDPRRMRIDPSSDYPIWVLP